jgi:hypothetical protein
VRFVLAAVGTFFARLTSAHWVMLDTNRCDEDGTLSNPCSTDNVLSGLGALVSTLACDGIGLIQRQTETYSFIRSLFNW